MVIHRYITDSFRDFLFQGISLWVAELWGDIYQADLCLEEVECRGTCVSQLEVYVAQCFMRCRELEIVLKCSVVEVEPLYRTKSDRGFCCEDRFTDRMLGYLSATRRVCSGKRSGFLATKTAPEPETVRKKRRVFEEVRT